LGVDICRKAEANEFGCGPVYVFCMAKKIEFNNDATRATPHAYFLAVNIISNFKVLGK
jgi:hypothetical protein